MSNAKIAQIQATTQVEQIHAQVTIDALEATQAVLIADAAKSNIDMWIRVMFAIGPAVYITKIFLWDKVMGSITGGNTDPLDPNLWAVMMTIIGFYFVSAAITSATRIFKS